MQTALFWVPTPFPGRLAVAPRPRGGDWLDDEMLGWRNVGIDAVVSMLTPNEAAELDLKGEGAAAASQGVRFRTFPVPDRAVPSSRAAFRELVEEVVSELAAGRRVAVHCRQGIGRAGLVAAAVLIAAGLNASEAVERVSAARGRPVPETPAQRRWLDEFAKETTPAETTGGREEETS